jgi:hypothetical protein
MWQTVSSGNFTRLRRRYSLASVKLDIPVPRILRFERLSQRNQTRFCGPVEVYQLYELGTAISLSLSLSLDVAIAKPGPLNKPDDANDDTEVQKIEKVGY